MLDAKRGAENNQNEILLTGLEKILNEGKESSKQYENFVGS